jgi:hypothetical protein
MIGVLVSLAIAAREVSVSYGDALLEAMHKRYPEISGAHISATSPQGTAITLDRHWAGIAQSSVKQALFDATGNEIGTLVVESRCASIANVEKIQSELSRRIYSSSSLAERDPLVAGSVRAAYGQAMIEEALDRDPGLITLAFHVTAPGAKVNTIVASSFGRIGKPGDSDDEQVIREGTTRREVTNDGRRVAIELPLLDAHGNVIGALSTSFRSGTGTDAHQLEKRAIALRDSLARRTQSLKALFRPATASRQVRSLRSCHP